MNSWINVDDYRKAARRRLPRRVFDYLEGGAEDERGLRHNCEAFAKIRFRPKRLHDVSTRDMSRVLFHRRLPLPLVIAPTGLNDLFWPQGDLALARSAARHGLPFVLSTAASTSIEDIARQADGEHWFQLYVVHRRLAEQLVRRALAADYTTLVLTVDVVRNGTRERDLRNRFALPLCVTPGLLWDGLTHPRWSVSVLRHGLPRLANFADIDPHDIEMQAAVLSRSMDATFDWNGLAWLRDLWPHRLLVKGLLTAADATRCVLLGVDGVVVSNHGGRQLDDCIAPIEALADVRAATRAPILIDSGFRRGSDIAKAIALGADIVMLGRATLYGLAARGERGVDDVIGLLRAQLDSVLVQLGCPSLDQLDCDYLHIATTGSRHDTEIMT
ncbi:alpha-hydroxy-acid oxidizing protein [Rhodanobacter sp. AS-Z3]|uniref:alpha-hydroxy-acid oxidizing protein n=1 Tax=Rhodanobacter sp. AS-Z3 TaxID=3031330 RepID=UPI002479FB90|nr:alpha-hydroxy-acid oxidizing protein [Rhodanobacter sp. AS-Z3]WEN15087.1 alpha-hydroxy-acid oxidizing protein [Rhodanobacter sp. AS-Z3]